MIKDSIPYSRKHVFIYRGNYMKKVVIEPGCITCGACEFIVPQVFEVTDICHVKKNVDLQSLKEEIRQAAIACPVNVIKFEE